MATGACGNGGHDSHGDTRDTQSAAPPTARSVAPRAEGAPASARTLVDLLQVLPTCDVEHRGQLLDLGSDAMVGRYGWARGVPPGVTRVEHDGATWARMLERRLQVSFTLAERTPIFVAARGEGYASKTASVLLDDQPLGTLTFAREQIRVAQTPTTTLPLDPGNHLLTFRFSGRTRDGDAFADLDWLRIGIPDDVTSTYTPPTARDLLAPAVALGGVPHRSIALHARGAVRCAARLARGVRLRVAVGLDGVGEARAEVRTLRDGKPPVSLASVPLSAEKPAWADLDLPLDPDPAGVTLVELAAVEAQPGARVLFGDPALVLDQPPTPPPQQARVAVVVVLDGVERAELPPWASAATALPALADLASHAAVFDRHRAPTTFVSVSVATLLTGLEPAANGLVDGGARLSAGAVTVAAIARDASVRTAMFTGVPHTFKAFGFASAWERFVEHSPSAGALATAPIDDATSWINELAKGPPDARHLVVVHARGGHPPWDVTPKELAAAAPHDYAGLIEPRRAPQTLAKMRHAKRAKVVTDADRQRVRALETLGLAGEDRALGALIAAMKAAGVWEGALFVVTGDVASGASEFFGDGLDLKEPLLTLPLYVHFPGGLGAGKRIAEPTDVADLAPTLLRALGLAPAKEAHGRDLAKLALDLDVSVGAPQVATLDDRYSARWGDLVLTGRYPRPPSLCDLSLDATCVFDRRDTMPIAVSSIFRRLVAADSALRALDVKREPASLDEDTIAALRVWGDYD